MHKTKLTGERLKRKAAAVSIDRRRFTQWLAASAILGGSRIVGASAPVPESSEVGGLHRLRVAAVQMTPKLGDVEANLAQAENLIREAIKRGAEWVLLPEMFTSAAAFHKDIITAVRPIDGPPARLLQDMARESGTVLGGSFLASDGSRVFNSFLASPPEYCSMALFSLILIFSFFK